MIEFGENRIHRRRDSRFDFWCERLAKIQHVHGFDSDDGDLVRHMTALLAKHLQRGLERRIVRAIGIVGRDVVLYKRNVAFGNDGFRHR